jgi:flagellar protein FlaJ
VKRSTKVSFKPVPPFQLFYQLTYMSAMASSGISRSKLFELAANSPSQASVYFTAINTLVDEFRYDYPEACRMIGTQAKSNNMRSFLLRLSDAMRSGEPMPDFLSREAEAQGEDYENRYERDLEALKQWSNAFSSIVISVALIIIIQVISSMIQTLNVGMITGLIVTGVLMSAMGAWIIYRSAPAEILTVGPAEGSAEQKRAMRWFRILLPVGAAGAVLLYLLGVELGIILIMLSAVMLPVGVLSMLSDRVTTKKDEEISTFLRSSGGMATASGSTLKQALTMIDLSSFPALERDIDRLSKRLQALVDPEICWHKFGRESGSKLISEVIDIFYSAIKIGGDPERAGYLCSLFAAKTSQLRAKRRLIAGTFSGLSTVMHGVVAALMVFVLSIVTNFTEMVSSMMPQTEAAADGQQSVNMGLTSITPADLQFLAAITVVMVLLLAVVSAAAIIFTDGGLKLKLNLYMALDVFISGVSFIVVPPMVMGILRG